MSVPRINIDDIYSSTYRKDYDGAYTPRSTNEMPRMRPVEPVLMPRPFILKSQPRGGGHEPAEQDSRWHSTYRNSYRSHHRNRYEVAPSWATARYSSDHRPLYLPPVAGPTYYAGSQTDRPMAPIIITPRAYSPPASERQSRDPTWQSTYKKDFHEYGQENGYYPFYYPYVYNAQYMYVQPRPEDGDQRYLSDLELMPQPAPALPTQQPQQVEADHGGAEAAAATKLFRDPHFDPEEKSFLLTEKFDQGVVKWMRPGELSIQPVLFTKNHIVHDFQQGFLRDGWFLIGCAAISRFPQLVRSVIPPDQRLEGAAYSGKVFCNFCKFGNWRSITVDDRLPTYADDLTYARSDDPDEFWISFLEKAYAKMFGSYEALEGGSVAEAITDLTGGITEFYSMRDLQRAHIDLEFALYQASRFQAMVMCSKQALDEQHEQEYKSGLIAGHAYEVTGVFLVPWKRGNDEMILRIQSPWGYHKDWTGPWSDLDPRWNSFTREFKEYVGFTNKPVGEFFISYTDFIRNFHHVSICHLDTPLYLSPSDRKMGSFAKCYGEWALGLNAGGSSNNISSFATNPQFHVMMDGASDEEDPLYRDNKEVLIVCLQQVDNRAQRHSLEHVGFSMYEVDGRSAYLPLGVQYLAVNAPTYSSGGYHQTRDLVRRFRVNNSDLVIVPSTYQSERAAQFLLRVFSTAPISVQSYGL